jgi:hypothetical protein
MTNNTELHMALEALPEIKAMIDSQEPLPPEMAKVLYDNLWSLYDDKAALAQREHDGEWVMVPREPTDVMIQAGLNAPAYGHPETATPKLCDIYKVMLSAAPAPALCAAEEAAELANKVTSRDVFPFAFCKGQLNKEELAAIINADRAKR